MTDKKDAPDAIIELWQAGPDASHEVLFTRDEHERTEEPAEGHGRPD